MTDWNSVGWKDNTSGQGEAYKQASSGQPEKHCPECGSHDITKRHHSGSFLAPECDFYSCEDCNHQFDHS